MREALQDKTNQAIKQIQEVFLGNKETVKIIMAGFLSGGHILIEDMPGLGKTTLSKAFAATLGIDFKRIQFTADLLPSDILGSSILERDIATGRNYFNFHKGPIFTSILLADEINRSPPRTQSALLEAMAEKQVTIEREHYKLPEHFFVIGTQNPVDITGTFNLPDSQMDRFTMRLTIGYPDKKSEKELLMGQSRQKMIDEMKPIFDNNTITSIKRSIQEITVSGEVIDYMQSLTERTRSDAKIKSGLSPRAALAWLEASKAYAWIIGGKYVHPKHLQHLFPYVCAHRITFEHGIDTERTLELTRQWINETPIS